MSKKIFLIMLISVLYILCESGCSKNNLYEKSTVQNEQTKEKIYFDKGEFTNADNICDTTQMKELFGARENILTGEISEFIFVNEVSNMFDIPGMLQTNVKGEMCEDMIPQGIVLHNGHWFITAYCYKKEHNSVMYVLDAKENNLVTTLVLDSKTRAGGIAYANGYLWIAATSKVYYYDYNDIKEIVDSIETKQNVKSVSVSKCKHGSVDMAEGIEASFLGICDSYLCIGAYQTILQDNKSIYFCNPIIKDDGKIEIISSMLLPQYAQSMSIIKDDGKSYMLINVAMADYDSCVYVYEMDEQFNAKIVKKIYVPCFAKGIYSTEEKTYILFQSCAKKYRENIKVPIGSICAIDNELILGRKQIAEDGNAIIAEEKEFYQEFFNLSDDEVNEIKKYVKNYYESVTVEDNTEVAKLEEIKVNKNWRNYKYCIEMEQEDYLINKFVVVDVIVSKGSNTECRQIFLSKLDEESWHVIGERL